VEFVGVEPVGTGGALEEKTGKVSEPRHASRRAAPRKG
jgi:hypothetical protein